MQNFNLEESAFDLFDLFYTSEASIDRARKECNTECDKKNNELNRGISSLKSDIATLTENKNKYNKYISNVHSEFNKLCTQKRRGLAKAKVDEYNKLRNDLKSAKLNYQQAQQSSGETNVSLEEYALTDMIFKGESMIPSKYCTLHNTILKVAYIVGVLLFIVAILAMLNGDFNGGILSKEYFTYGVMGYFALIVAIIVIKIADSKTIIEAIKNSESRANNRIIEEAQTKIERLEARYSEIKTTYRNFIDKDTLEMNFTEKNVSLPASIVEQLFKAANSYFITPAKSNGIAISIEIKLERNNDKSYIVDNGEKVYSAIDTAILKLKSALVALESSRSGAISQIKIKYDDKIERILAQIKEAQSELENNANSSIVTRYQPMEKHASALKELLAQAKKRTILEYIPVGHITNSEQITIPLYFKWQSREKGYKSNLWVSYDDESADCALQLTNSILNRILVAFAAGSINFSFFDLDFSGFQNEFLHLFDGIEERLYNHRIYTSSDDIRTKIAQLKNKLAETQKISRNNTIVDHYCSGEQGVTKPYEVVVVYNIDQHNDIVSELRPLIANGNDSGIYIIVLQPTSSEADRSHTGSYSLKLDDFKIIEVNAEDSSLEKQSFTPFNRDILAGNSPIVEQYCSELKRLLEDNYESSKVSIDFSEFYNTPYSDPSAGVSIPIGVSSADNTILNVNICGDDSAHSLILGETGSGKSVLFQDLITSCTLKYSPKDLSLYLIDLKSGGVGFNSYVQDYVPHVKSVLQNNTDMEVIRSCFVQIAEEVERRGELMQECGVAKIEDYNRVAEPDERLPRIIIAIDECQKLLRSEYGDLRDSIEEILRMGRNSGVNLILATQTIDAALSAMTVNIANMFVMKSSDPNINAAIRRDSGVDNVSLTYGINSFMAGEALFIQRAKIVKFRAHNIESNHRDILKAVQNKAVLNVTGGDLDKLKSLFKPFIYNSRLKVHYESISEGMLAETQRMGNSVILGRDLLRSDERYVTVALANNSRNSNMLVIGDMSLSSDESKTANNRMRAIISSIISIRGYYKRENKPYKIAIINNYNYDDSCQRLLSIVSESDDNCFIVDDASRDRYIKELHERAERGKDESAIDTYLFILEGQMWYDYGELSSGVDHRKCMMDILAKGFIANIHTIVSVDNIESCENMFSYRGSMTTGFAHTLHFRMKEADVKRLGIRSEISTSTLSINAKQLRAIYFDRKNNKATLLLPFEFPEETFMARV